MILMYIAGKLNGRIFGALLPHGFYIARSLRMVTPADH